MTNHNVSLRGGKLVVRPTNSRSRYRGVSPTQAKVPTPAQLDKLFARVSDKAAHSKRDTVLMLLSYGAGLRVQEIAGLRWTRNVLDPAGDVMQELHITSDIGKRTVARTIPANQRLKVALRQLRAENPKSIFVVTALYEPRGNPKSRRVMNLAHEQISPNTLAQYMRRLYAEFGLQGCTSHSGRRTFITRAARKCNTVGASLRDVQLLAGHRSLASTEVYIEPSKHQHALVNSVL